MFSASAHTRLSAQAESGRGHAAVGVRLRGVLGFLWLNSATSAEWEPPSVSFSTHAFGCPLLHSTRNSHSWSFFLRRFATTLTGWAGSGEGVVATHRCSVVDDDASLPAYRRARAAVRLLFLHPCTSLLAPMPMAPTVRRLARRAPRVARARRARWTRSKYKRKLEREFNYNATQLELVSEWPKSPAWTSEHRRFLRRKCGCAGEASTVAGGRKALEFV